MAIEALGATGDESAFDPLVARFSAGVNGFDEWYIVAALRDIGTRERTYDAMKSHPDPETRRMLGRVAGEWSRRSPVLAETTCLDARGS